MSKHQDVVDAYVKKLETTAAMNEAKRKELSDCCSVVVDGSGIVVGIFCLEISQEIVEQAYVALESADDNE